jgi:tetratricopeptide (TPR) repeat protein
MVALATSVAEGGDAREAGRFRPVDAGYVVLRVPATTSSEPIAILEQKHARAPQDEALASELAQLYVSRARADREPRYFARAEALVRPWVAARGAGASSGVNASSASHPSAGGEASSPPGASAATHASTLRVQADILQNRHDFAGALTLLDRAIALDPRDASARLMRASVKMVGGHAAEARADCANVLASGEPTTGTICLAQVLGATGSLTRAEALLKTVISRNERAPSVRAWALWLLADFSDRAGDAPAAEAWLREALEAAPQNEGIRSALSDLLLARGVYREALNLVDLPAPSIGLLARRAQAQQALRDPALEQTRSLIEDLVTLASRRGDPPHLREEALVALEVDHDPARALELAKANFDTQRETIDIRLLIKAATMRGDTATLSSVHQWIHETGYEDRQLPAAASNLGSST